MSLCIPSNNPVCQDPECKKPGCKGNRLEELSETWPDLPAGYNHKLLMVVNHHKLESCQWANKGPLEVPIPRDFTAVNHAYLQHCHPQLASSSRSKLLFPRKCGSQHTHQTFNTWWAQIQERSEAPWDAFPPGGCRKLFAEFTLEQFVLRANAMLGPEAHGSVNGMNSSMPMLHRHYARGSRNAYVGAAVEALQAWRERALAQWQQELMHAEGEELGEDAGGSEAGGSESDGLSGGGGSSSGGSSSDEDEESEDSYGSADSSSDYDEDYDTASGEDDVSEPALSSDGEDGSESELSSSDGEEGGTGSMSSDEAGDREEGGEGGEAAEAPPPPPPLAIPVPIPLPMLASDWEQVDEGLWLGVERPKEYDWEAVGDDVWVGQERPKRQRLGP